ncbi:hypothetical protein Q5752_002605 [Cryptotrichosporon argae]
MASAIPASLRPAARSAYRAVLRSARLTFNGDPQRYVALHTALRSTFTSPTLRAPGAGAAEAAPDPLLAPVDTQVDYASEAELAKRIAEWDEVARFLRRNVVQGVQQDSGSFRLRVTPDTELGDNATIKSPPQLPVTPFPNRNRRRRKCGDEGAGAA